MLLAKTWPATVYEITPHIGKNYFAGIDARQRVSGK